MQPPPDTPALPASAASRFFVAHWRIGRAIYEHMNPLLEKTYGLNYRDFLVLAAIGRGVHYPTELAERLKLPRDMTSRVLQTLLRAGFVERAIDAHDSRRTRLEVTPTGKELHAAVQKSVEGFLEPLLAQLGEGRSEQFLTLLETLNDLLSQAIGENHATDLHRP